MSKKINITIPNKVRPNLVNLFHEYLSRKAKEPKRNMGGTEAYIFDEYDDIAEYWDQMFPGWDDDLDDGDVVYPPSNVIVMKPKKEKNFVEKMFHRADTWKSRIMKFGKPKPSPQEYDLDKDAQVAHANIAIVSSGVIGKGPGKSTERDFLSQAFSDFIYAIIIEELGIVGAFVVMCLYIFLLYRCARIASRCENNFPAFLAMGLGLLLVIQATFNMMVAVGLAPVTGQPLPLISKGGTSTIINCAYIGAILSVSRSAKQKLEKEENKEI